MICETGDLADVLATMIYEKNEKEEDNVIEGQGIEEVPQTSVQVPTTAVESLGDRLPIKESVGDELLMMNLEEVILSISAVDITFGR